MHIIPIFLPNFLNFSHFGQLWPNFWASPTFFPIFFQLIINYHVFFILDYPHFIIFCVFFWVKMHIIPIFLPNFLNFSHFWQLWPNFWASPTFFSHFFSTDNNLSCLLYSSLASFYNFLCIFLGQNAYNTNFYQIFSIFPIFDNFDLIFGPPLIFFPFFFQLIISYHVIFILDYLHFIIFYVFFCVEICILLRNMKLPIFS